MNKKRIGIYLNTLSIFMTVCILCIGLWMYQTGFHNNDLGWNFKSLNAEIDDCGITITGDHGHDFSGQHVYFTVSDMIVIGGYQMQLGLLFTGLGAFLFGMALFTRF